MNVLITSEYYYPHVGGAEKVAQIIAEGLVAKGHLVTVATTFQNRKSEILNGVKIIEFNITGNSAKRIKENKKGDIIKYQELLLDDSFDVIVQYAAQTWHTDIAFMLLDKISAKKILIPCGFSGLTTFLRKMLYFNYFKKMPFYLKKYNKLVFLAPNYIDTKFALRNGINNYSIIPNGIFLDEFNDNTSDFRKKYNLPTQKKIILNVSNHYKLKGHHQLINAFSKSQHNKDSILVIIGNDPGGRTSCFSSCSADVSKNDNVYMISNVSRKYVVSAYLQCDLFILSSYIEYYPLVLIEAMYSRKPIISMNVGCVKEYCDCILIDKYNDLANAINNVFSISQTDKINNNYQKVVNELVWDKIIDRYNQVICENG